jgi:hypothetical protein
VHHIASGACTTILGSFFSLSSSKPGPANPPIAQAVSKSFLMLQSHVAHSDTEVKYESMIGRYIVEDGEKTDLRYRGRGSCVSDSAKKVVDMIAYKI